ncbi:MAG: DUF4199 domain-containing protein [Paludibacter sp.]|nr:DUF4199 domain-containing protein [Paludibacter sp.]
MLEKLKNSTTINGILYVGGLLSLKFLFSVINNPLLTILSLLISVAVIFVLYKVATNYRIHQLNDEMSYGGAFRYCFQLYFFGSIIYTLVFFIYTTFINKNYFQVMMDAILQMYDKMNIKVEDNIYDLLNTMYQPIPMAFLSLLGAAVSAAFWAFIIAFFVKKEKSIFDKNV